MYRVDSELESQPDSNCHYSEYALMERNKKIVKNMSIGIRWFQKLSGVFVC